jgi:glycosyltransferase involved in cell wall biosynthesis
MRTLIVADEFPWPADTGYRMRLDHVVRGLADAGCVDLVAVSDQAVTPPVPDDVPVDRVEILHLPAARRTVGGYLRWIAGRSPRTVAARPWAGVRAAIPEIVEAWAPDVVWWSHADVYAEVGTRVTTRSVVDLDNLEDRKLRDRRRARRQDLRDAGERPAVDMRARDLMDRVDEHRFRRRQRRIVHSATRTVVCSDLDRARLDAHEVVVVPNGYDPPPDLGPTRAPDPATFTLIGLFSYEPNLDAARWLVRAVFPHLRRRLPDAQLRLVGHHDGELNELAGPGVTVTGGIASVVDELNRATAVVVPMRFGGGTRLKVLEAFACGVPVVSTRLGAEGLGATDQRELLLADDARRLAEACVDVVRRPGATAVRVAAARELWEQRYSGARVRAAVAEVVRAAAGVDPSRARR